MAEQLAKRSWNIYFSAKALGALTVVLIFIANILIAAPPARATEGTPISIDSVRFSTSEIPDGSRQEIVVDWSVSGQATNPVTVVIALPAGLRGFSDRFPMLDPDNVAAGECVVETERISCSVDPEYIEGHELEMRGSFTFLVDVWLENVETIEKIFEFGTVTSMLVTILPNPKRCIASCEWSGWGAHKNGTYQNLLDTISWRVAVPTGPDGIPAGDHITIVDALDLTVFELVGEPRVREARSLRYDSLGRQSPFFVWKSPSEYTVSADGLRVDFESVAGLGDMAPDGYEGIAGSVYEVVWTVKALDLGKAKTYTNIANWEIDGNRRGTTTGTAIRYSGSGTVVGKNFGRFQLTKELTGDTSLTPSFTVKYTCELDGVVTEQATITIRAGESFLSEELFRGTKITLDELKPVDPANVSWANPVFVLPDGTRTDHVALLFDGSQGKLGKVTEIVLSNTAILKRASIGAEKTIENPDGIRFLEDATFTLNYIWEANPELGIPAGGGAVQMPANGSRVAITGLPIGAVVDFYESTPKSVPGASWQQPTIEPARVAIKKDTANLTIQVTNTITRDVGSFDIRKHLEGTGLSLVKDPTFTVQWSYPADPLNGIYDADAGTLDVTANGDPVAVEGLPAGAVITLEEVRRPVEGGTWQDPIFSQKNFTILRGTHLSIDLSNELTLNTGEFSVVKRINGTGADLVRDTDTFTVHYEYDGVAGFGPGAGELILRADGEAVSSGPLPYGAVLRLSELKPAPIAGATWAEEYTFTPNTITIGDGTTVEVTLTNTITRDVGSITLRKRIEGTGAHLIEADREYRFTYEYSAGTTWNALGPTEVVIPGEGTTVAIDDLPAGAVVTIRELPPPAVQGGTWGAPRFSLPNATKIEKNSSLEILVTNTLELNTGAFSVTKRVEGSGADLLAKNTAFTIEYHYSAGRSFEAGSGTLTVSNGSTATSDPIPYGAEVILKEHTPLAIPGAAWTGSHFSAESILIGDNTVTEITLTNRLEHANVDGRLASTGSDGAGALTLIGALALIVGLVVLGRSLLNRRRVA